MRMSAPANSLLEGVRKSSARACFQWEHLLLHRHDNADVGNLCD
jgi:hypothetical protein